MNIPNNITKEHLLLAITKIDEEGIPKGGDSQYYDVVYNGKKYPPKLIVSYANLFANGEVLNRKLFDGGLDTECFNLMNKYQFEIEKKNENLNNKKKVWFVTQGATFTAEKGMKFLWAPKKAKDGNSRFFWENLLKVKKGDIIFHFSEGVKGVSIAKSDGYSSNNEEISSKWSAEGFKVDVEITLLEPVIFRDQLVNKKNDLNRYLNSISNKPFNITGGVNQGYLYEFNKEAGRCIRNIYGKNFGNEVIDDFFDSVNLDEIKIIPNTSMNFNQIDFFNQSKSVKFFIDKKLSCRFISSLLTKPFVILTGLSGSGKTKLAQAFALWICENEKQYCIVPVGADWTNREPLLGYPNALELGKYVLPENGALQLIIDANNNPNEPFFLILDEMNLSHVERYFADFLSVMESTQEIPLHSGTTDYDCGTTKIPCKLNLPKNIFIIGTVNIDETTYMFSPKVLDRANVIEFRVTGDEMQEYLNSSRRLNMDALLGAGANMATNFVEIALNEKLETKDAKELADTLMVFFNELKRTGTEFGYRTASEILRFAAVVNFIEPEWTITDIIDAAIMQKLLPKLHGSRSKLNKPLTTLAKFCIADGTKDYDGKDDEFRKTYFIEGEKIPSDKSAKIIYPLSFEKLARMHKNVIENGFTSYAEA